MTAQDINKIFREKGRTLGCCESFTGGTFASEITSIPGASHFFKGGFVTYFTEEKARILGISYNLIDEHGVVSQEIAAEMAGHAQKLLNVDYCVSFTGNAGPEAMEGKPVGDVYIGISVYQQINVYHYRFNGDRKKIQRQAIDAAYELLAQLIDQFK